MEVTLDFELVRRLTADPALYASVPFLKPMEKAAMSLHEKLRLVGNCETCNKPTLILAVNKLASAMTRLTVIEQSQKSGNAGLLREVVGKIIGKDITVLVLPYTEGDQKYELRV